MAEWSIVSGAPTGWVAGSDAGLDGKALAGGRLGVIFLAGNVAFEAGFLAGAFAFAAGLAGMGIVMPGID